jgi:hypothetical protein
MIQEAPAQLSFVEKTSFVLASNKSSNNSNKVVGIISELQSGNKNESDVRTYFDTLAKRTNQDLNGYIKDVLNLENKVLEQFLLKTFFTWTMTISLQSATVKSKMILQNKIEQAFKMIDSTLRSDNFFKSRIKSKLKFHLMNFTKI